MHNQKLTYLLKRTILPETSPPPHNLLSNARTMPPNTLPTIPQPHSPPHLLRRTPLLLARMPHPMHQLIPPAPRPRRLALDQVPRFVALGLLGPPPQAPPAAVRGEAGGRRGLEGDVEVRDEVDVVGAERGVAVGAGAAEGGEGLETHFGGLVVGLVMGWVGWFVSGVDGLTYLLLLTLGPASVR